MNNFDNISIKRKLLIVDDSLINKAILKKILDPEFKILTASNGQEALDILQIERLNIAIILLDINMPVMDGYEFLVEFKKLSISNNIPVIIQTHKDNDEDEVKALSLGANDFVTKPYNAKIILYRIKNLISFRENASIVRILQYDSLTQLLSKDYFYQQALQYLTVHSDRKYKLLVSDIANFKIVNDMFGMDLGNKVLANYASILKTYFPSTPLARIGADVFAVLLPQEVEVNEEIVAKINDSLNSSQIISMNMTLKFGLYMIEDIHVNISQMCDRAVLAIKAIKGIYGKNLIVYDDSFLKNLLKEQIIQESMESALVNNEFKVYFQPKYDFNANKISGAEALVRWISKENGFMNPGDFIPLFERNGFISRLDYFVWENTCKVLSKWKKEGKELIPISVNVSRVDFYTSHIVDDLLSLIKTYDIPIEYLHLEITESAYTTNPEQIIHVVKDLKRLGFLVEMDDFGTGYSSLNMLSELPIDYLKLDMKFVQEGLLKRESKTIIQFIITLAKWLNLNVIAEGVETQLQANQLKDMGCDMGQGYLYSKPVPIDQFEKLLVEKPMVVEPSKPIAIDNEVYFSQLDFTLENKPMMLIVDDGAINCALLTSIFENYFTILTAENGAVGLKLLLQHPKQIKIIMLDLIMPILNGYQMLTEIKKNPKLANIPVIITSQDSEAAEIDALNLGADDFISKPYFPSVVKQRVKNVIFRKFFETKLQQKVEYSLNSVDVATGFLNTTGLKQYFTNCNKEKNTTNGLILLEIKDIGLIINTKSKTYFNTLCKKLFTITFNNLSNIDIVALLDSYQICIIVEDQNDKEELKEITNNINNSINLDKSIDVKIAITSTLYSTHESFSKVFSKTYKKIKEEK